MSEWVTMSVVVIGLVLIVRMCESDVTNKLYLDLTVFKRFLINYHINNKVIKICVRMQRQ